jgi:hypothetical protein
VLRSKAVRNFENCGFRLPGVVLWVYGLTNRFERIELYSITGELLAPEKFASTNSYKGDLSLASGIYFIRTEKSGMMKIMVGR